MNKSFLTISQEKYESALRDGIDENRVLKRLYEKYLETNTVTNNIYFCIGTFYNKFDDEIKSYNRYVNIENMFDYYDVFLKDIEEFEKNHTVLHYEKEETSFTEYLNTKKDFFKTAITESEEKAIQKVLKK